MSDQNIPVIPAGFESIDLSQVSDPIAQMQEDFQQRESRKDNYELEITNDEILAKNQEKGEENQSEIKNKKPLDAEHDTTVPQAATINPSLDEVVKKSQEMIAVKQAAKGIADHHEVALPEGFEHKHVVIGGAKKNINSQQTKENLSMSSSEEHLDIEDVIESALKLDASDIHLAAGSKIGFRVHGHIRFIENIPELSDETMMRLFIQLVRKDTSVLEKFEKTREYDGSFVHGDGTAFRVNGFFKRKNLAVVMRVIPSKVRTMEELHLPPAAKHMADKKQGIILVTGPTGSGKSTSMQAILQYINQTRVEHILTIEDPIEFMFENDKSIFSQREIGHDTLSFDNALRASLREDPDIVMIGEMRDPETIQTAISLAETGHLVISTLHTSGAPQTVSRVINAFPPEQQHFMQHRLADALIGVLSQRLVPRADIEGRIGIFEVMMVNSAIRNIIRTGDMAQIHNAIQAGRSAGMVKMETYADELAKQGIIHKKDYQGFFREE